MVCFKATKPCGKRTGLNVSKIHKIDLVILTHAHIDHSGYIPLLVRKGFKEKSSAQEGTLDLCKILLRDSGHIHEEDARRANKYGYSRHKVALPLYTEEALKALSTLKPFLLAKLMKSVKISLLHLIGLAIF